MGNSQSCIRTVSGFHRWLRTNHPDYTILTPEGQSHCFRVRLLSTGNPVPSHFPWGASISVSPDRMGNRGDEYGEGEPTTWEIALVDSNDELTYIDGWGYDDVRSFFNEDADPRDFYKRLFTELQLLRSLLEQSNAAGELVSRPGYESDEDSEDEDDDNDDYGPDQDSDDDCKDNDSDDDDGPDHYGDRKDESIDDSVKDDTIKDSIE